MKNKKIIIGLCCGVVIIIGIFLVLIATRKPVEKNVRRADHSTKTKTPIAVDYSGIGNTSGNLQNGGDQAYVQGRGVVIDNRDDSGSQMLCFDDSTQKLQFYCNKRSCLHNGTDCITNQQLSYMVSYGDVVFAVSGTDNSEIWKIQNNEITCIYRSKNHIGGLWGYRKYLYFMNDFGIYRISIDDPSKEEQVLDKPVSYEYVTFYKDKIYFCLEDLLLYQANLDGSDKKRFCDEKAASPQICGDYLYYRCMEYDKKGRFEVENTLKRISLTDHHVEKVLDEVYLFNIDEKNNKIYYQVILNDEDVSLRVLDIASNKSNEVTKCAMGALYVCPESDWLVIQQYEGQLKEGQVGARPTHLYCVKKDGSGEKRLDYPKKVEG